MKTRVINYSELKDTLRFDGSYHNAEINVYDNVIKKHSEHNLSFYCSDIFTPGRNKRIYTQKEFGYPFLSNTEIVAADPLLTCKYSSKKYGSDESSLLKKGMILTGRVGAIGQTAFVPDYLEKIKALGSDNIIRIRVKPEHYNGFLYAYLASRIGYLSFWKHATGGVQPFITDKMVGELPIPDFPDSFKREVDNLIQMATSLREEAIKELVFAEKMLKEKANLSRLTSDYYDYYGHRNNKRKVSCFTRNIQEIGTITINAFNHSERIRRLKETMSCPVISLKEALKEGRTYGTSGLPNIEVKPGHGIMLINQKDMFDNIVKGKWISSRGSDPENVLEYGEILIACDGTLGENELFCRAVFVNEDLQGSYVSSHFLRLKVNDEIPAGYLYCWINSDYGFRFIRNTQAGTKLCHPINKLFLEIPVPAIEKEDMLEIDRIVREAHTKRHQANQKELKAISMVEQEIEKWNN